MKTELKIHTAREICDGFEYNEQEGKGGANDMDNIIMVCTVGDGSEMKEAGKKKVERAGVKC